LLHLPQASTFEGYHTLPTRRTYVFYLAVKATQQLCPYAVPTDWFS